MSDLTATGTAKGEVEVVEPSRAQQLVARRTAESRAIVPEARFAIDVEVPALADGAELDDHVVAAVARALRAVPEANAAYRDAKFERYSRVNVGVVVHGDQGVTVPTIFDADTKSAARISEERRALAARAAEGTLRAPELGGATFTVWSVDVDRFDAIIIPPQAGALAVGAPSERPVVRDGAVVPGRVATLTLSADHRILYGETAARFLAHVREELGRK